MRAVLDPNVLISAALAPGGSPARLFRLWLDGAYEIVVSPKLLGELARELAYPKIRTRVTESEAADVVDVLRRGAKMVDDPPDPPAVRSPDPDDDYLIALAAEAHALLVSGDGHLLGLAEQLPVFTPAQLLSELDDGGTSGPLAAKSRM